MMNQPNQSDVARLRTQIELEHQAMVWALTGLCEGNTQHAYISRRMGHTEIAYKGLRRLVGDEEATDILSKVWENSPEQLALSQPKLTRADIEMLIAQSQGQPLDLSKKDLRFVNLNNLNLSGANMTEADLSQASLIDANLSHAHLTYANLSHADCSSSNLSSANLKEAYLVCTCLLGADLRTANLEACNMEGTNFQNATLVGARVHGAFLSNENKQTLLGRGTVGLDQTISIDHLAGGEEWINPNSPAQT